jgi:hypothetical protein
MRIVVCGDSWATPDKRVPGKHYSEILSEKYNYQVVNLARAGISNIGICFQIEQAIKLSPDAIILTGTDSDRISFAVGEFNTSNGLKNIRYTDELSATCSSEYVGDANAPIIDDVVFTLAKDCDWTILGGAQKNNISAEQKEAIKQYITYLHNKTFKNVTDSWAINYWQMMAQNSNIKILMIDPYMQFLKEKYNSDLQLSKWIFHTELETQIEIADLIAADLRRTN